MLWTLCSLCMTCFFTLAAYVQLNDPDGPLWVTIYGLPAVLTLLQVSSSNFKSHFLCQCLTWLHTTGCIIGALYLCYSVFFIKDDSIPDNMQWYEKEEGRELGGLSFVVLWLLLCQLQNRSMSNAWLSVLGILIVTTPVCLWLYTYFDEAYRENLPDHCKQSL